MQRLKRVFAIDIETCPKCGGTLRVIACTHDGFTRARATAFRRYFFQPS
jgi:rRNA maturation protein Nop10